MIEQILLKVTARCNLNCDYCYVFNMGDQSWKNLPRLMDKETMLNVIEFIATSYTSSDVIPSITFHGGEPLMYGDEPILFFIQNLQKRMPELKPNYSIQTNMFKKDILNSLQTLDEMNVVISASTDGDQVAMDRHRLTKNGKSSFELVHNNITDAYESGILSGLISVIDPINDVKRVLTYLSNFEECSVELLPMDSNWSLGDHTNLVSTAYWFTSAFKLWVDEFPDLEIRFFRHIIERISGINVGSDAFGGGVPNLISIEPDGSIHGLDVLKSIDENQSSTGLNIQTNSIEEVISSDHFKLHQHLLSNEGISSECKSCTFNDICQSGSVPHRWNGVDFNSKSAHCFTLHSLFSLASGATFDLAKSSFDESLKFVFNDGNISPYLVRNQEITFSSSSIPNSISIITPKHGKEILEERGLESVISDHNDKDMIEQVLLLINRWNPAISSIVILSNLKFCIVNPLTGPTSDLVSMTQSSFPQTLFLNIHNAESNYLDMQDIAENIIHETVHIILDVLLGDKLLTTSTEEIVSVPWREDLRPICGAFHGALVFCILSRFRSYIGDTYQAEQMLEDVRICFDNLEEHKLHMTDEGVSLYKYIRGEFLC